MCVLVLLLLLLYFYLSICADLNLSILSWFLSLSSQIKQTQDEEKKQLTALRDLIKSSLQLEQKEVGRSNPSSPGLKRLKPRYYLCRVYTCLTQYGLLNNSKKSREQEHKSLVSSSCGYHHIAPPYCYYPTMVSKNIKSGMLQFGYFNTLLYMF